MGRHSSSAQGIVGADKNSDLKKIWLRFEAAMNSTSDDSIAYAIERGLNESESILDNKTSGLDVAPNTYGEDEYAHYKGIISSCRTYFDKIKSETVELDKLFHAVSSKSIDLNIYGMDVNGMLESLERIHEYLARLQMMGQVFYSVDDEVLGQFLPSLFVQSSELVGLINDLWRALTDNFIDRISK